MAVWMIAACLLALWPTGTTQAAHQPAGEALFIVDLPVVIDGRRLGALPVETSVTTLRRIAPAALARIIGDAVNEETRARLEAGGDALVPVEALAALGVTPALDPQTLTITIEIALANRAANTASLARDWQAWDDTAIRPDHLAFGVTGALTVADSLSDASGSTAGLRLDGFANLGGLTGVSLDWGGQTSLRSNGEVSHRRDRIIAFSEDAARARRISVGDLAPQLSRNIGLLNLAGLAIETNYRDLQPTRNIRPTGDRSLVLDRPSTVEVYVNGALIDRFEAGPGPVDLRDIPLANTSNDILIVVEDELGRREADRFSLSANIALLATGLTESVFTFGFAREEGRSDFVYDDSRPVIGGSWSRGLSPALTASAAFAASADYQAASGALAFPVAGGIAQAELTASQSDLSGRGTASSLAFTGGPYWATTRGATLNLRLEHFSAGFTSLNTLDTPISTRWSLGGDVRFNLTPAMSMGLGAQFRDSHGAGTRSQTLSASLNRRFGEVLVSASARHTDFDTSADETGVFLTISRRFSGRHFVSASHDSLSRSTRLDWRRSRGEGLPHLQTRASAVTRPETTELRGGVDWIGSRASLQLSGDHRASRTGGADQTGYALRLQTGLAWADGQFGIGRDPGRGFVMVSRHASLDAARLAVSSHSNPSPVARADALGPAVLSVDAPYRPVRLRIDATGLAPGYDIGPGQYTLVSGSATGTRLTVGTPAFRTAIATLVRDGEPLALQYGQLIHLDSDARQAFFTNRTGRAAFNGLLPGPYEARLQDRAGTAFRFTLDDRAPAFVDLGRLDGDTDHD